MGIDLDDYPARECNPRRGIPNAIARFADGPHTVTVEVLLDSFDKRAMLFAECRQDFDRQPEKYADFAWHGAAILVVGELL